MKAMLFTLTLTGMLISLSYSREGQSLPEPAMIRKGSAHTGSDSLADAATAIAVDHAGNVYVTGYSERAASGKDYLTIKYNAAGIEQWAARYNGPGNRDDWPFALVVDGAGNVYVTGESHGGVDTGEDYATIKYNAFGEAQWVARYIGPENYDDQARDLAVDGMGNVYVTGTEHANLGGEYVTVKYNSSGEQQWLARYTGRAVALALDGAGFVYVTGYTHVPGRDCVTIKYNDAGVEQWLTRYNGPENFDDFASDLTVDMQNNVYVTGTSTASATGRDYFAVKYNASGEQQWASRYTGGTSLDDFANALAVDGDGNLYLTGVSGYSSLFQGGGDYATVKYDGTTGDTLWVRRYDGTAHSSDWATSLAVDAAGSVSVTGYSEGAGTGNDYLTIKYNAAGEQQWLARYNGVTSAYDAAIASAMDSAGNVYVTGRSDYDFYAGGGDYATIKYNASGAQEWVAHYDGLQGSTFVVLLAQGSDDAGDNPNCSYSTSSNEIYFGECSNGEEMVSGFRFQNFPISSPNEIQGAHLEFTADGPYSNDMEIEFFGEASGNARTFSDDDRPSDRSLTKQSVRWILNASEVWSVGEKRMSPDLTPIIREIVQRPGWQRGNALTIIVKNVSSNGSHRRVFAVERQGQLKATKLVVKTEPQRDFALVQGTVVESGSNAPIAGATVFLRPVVTGGFATTDPNGRWRMTIPGGRGYELRILADGYEMIEERHLDFPRGTTTTLFHEMIPYVPPYDDYRIVPVALAPNPDVLEIPEGGVGYAWFVVEGLKNGTWLPVPDANIQYRDAEGIVQQSKSNQILYSFLTLPFHFQNAGVFPVTISASLIENGTPGSTERITVFSVNYRDLPEANQASILAKVVPYEYTVSWGYRIYRKGGLGATGGIATGTAFVGGGSGATIEIELAGLDANPDWSSFKVLRRDDLFVGAEIGLRPVELINILEIGPRAELKASFPYQGEYRFDMDNLQGLEALMAFYLFLEPSILFAGSSVPGGQFAVNFLAWTTEILISNSGENGLAIVRTADEAGLDIEGNVKVEATFGLVDPKKLGLGLGASTGIKAHLGGSVRSTVDHQLQRRFYAQGEYHRLGNIGLRVLSDKDIKSKFLYLWRMGQPVLPDEWFVGYEVLRTWQDDQWQETKFSASLGTNSALLNLYHLPGQIQEYSANLVVTSGAVDNTLLNTTKLPAKMLDIGTAAVNIVVDNSDFNDDVVHFLEAVYDEQNKDLPVQLGYGLDAEDRNELKIDLDLELPLASPVVLKLGGGLEGTESREYHITDGFWVKGMPYLRQEMPDPPLPQVKFAQVIRDLWQQITSGNLWEELLKVISGHITQTSLTETTRLSVAESSVQLNDRGSTLTLRSGSIPPGLDSAFCLYYEWTDEPVNKSISFEKRKRIQAYQRELRHTRQQAAGLHYGIGGFFRLQPLAVQFQDSTLLTVVYSDSEIVGLDENDLAVYWEDTQGIWRYLPSINQPDSNKVAAWIPAFRTYTVAPKIPQGSFGFSAEPDTLPADGVSTATITSELLYNNDGSLLTDGSLFTVTAARGRILTPDASNVIAGTQIAVMGGLIRFEFQADSLSYPVLITAYSLQGTAAGEMELPLYDVATPHPPTLLGAEPAENGIKITWQSGGEIDLAGYRIWFDSDTSGAPYNGTATVFGEDSPVTVGATDAYILAGLSQDSTYFIAVTALDISGKESGYSNELSLVTAIENPEAIQLPEAFSLGPNYPNPFNPITTIRYTIPKFSLVKIHIYNILGRRIKELMDETQQPGVHKVTWDGTNDAGIRVSSGTYFYRIQAADFVKVRKMVLVR